MESPDFFILWPSNCVSLLGISWEGAFVVPRYSSMCFQEASVFAVETPFRNDKSESQLQGLPRIVSFVSLSPKTNSPVFPFSRTARHLSGHQ